MKRLLLLLLLPTTLLSQTYNELMSKMSNVKVLDTVGILKETDILELNKNNKVKVLGRGDI